MSSPSRFVVQDVFRKSGVFHSFEMVGPVLYVYEYQVLYPCILNFIPLIIFVEDFKIMNLLFVQFSPLD
jgi:hypothetical protein